MDAPEGRTNRLRDRLMIALVAVALLAPLGYLLVLAMSGADLVDVVQVTGPAPSFTGERYEALPWLVLAAVAAITALGAWWIDRRRAEGAAAALAEQKLSGELGEDGPVVCTSVAAWQPGDSGEDVIVRARGALAVL